LYQEWSAVYLNFYKTALRGQVAAQGTIAPPPVDWHAKLVQAEAKLLYEFHHWLRRGELYEIRSCIAQAARNAEKGRVSPSVEVFSDLQSFGSGAVAVGSVGNGYGVCCSG
jgi:hypothetical protein